jgi:hypothetical protein
MADFSREKKYDYNWQSSKFKDLLFKGNNVSALLNDIGYITLKDIPATSGSADTGSLIITASFSNPNLTFEKGNGNTFNVNLSTLIVNNAYTASYIDGGTF